MNKTQYRIVEYIEDYNTNIFNYFEGMASYLNNTEPTEIFAYYDTLDEALEDLKEFKCTLEHIKKSILIDGTEHIYYMYKLKEYVVERVYIDSYDNIVHKEFIEITWTDFDTFSNYFRRKAIHDGDLKDFDFVEFSDNLIRPIYQIEKFSPFISSEYYTTKKGLNIKDIKCLKNFKDLKKLLDSNYIKTIKDTDFFKELELEIYNLVTLKDFIRI